MSTRDDEARYATAWREAMAMAPRTGVRDRAAREDLAQEVLLRAWRHRRTERAWLWAAMRRCAAERRRDDSRAVAAGSLGARGGGERYGLSEERLDALRALRAYAARVEGLSAPLRSVYDAVLRDGRAIGDVARALGVTRAVVDTRLYRVKRRLRGGP